MFGYISQCVSILRERSRIEHLSTNNLGAYSNAAFSFQAYVRRQVSMSELWQCALVFCMDDTTEVHAVVKVA